MAKVTVLGPTEEYVTVMAAAVDVEVAGVAPAPKFQVYVFTPTAATEVLLNVTVEFTQISVLLATKSA